MKKIIFGLIAAVSITVTSCSDFLERAPQDALSPATFWQTESDAYLALVGTYNGLNNIYHNGHWTGYNCVMMDALSDNLFDYFSWEGYSVMTTGNITPTNNGVGGSWYQFSDIRACNEYLEMEGNVNWTSAGLEEQYKAEVRTIRALLYLYRSNWYGDFPLVTKTLDLEEAYAQARNPRAEVQAFIESELKASIDALPSRSNVAQGRICKEFAQGLLMRYYLWNSDYANAKTYAEAIVNSGTLSLAENFRTMFEVSNQYDKETIFDFSFISNTARDLYGNPFVANGALGGWSSIVPTVDLMDEFGTIRIPVKDKKHIKYDIVGSHLPNYDFMINLAHFKGHAMGGFGGVLKNASIGVASSAGKTYIHTAGKVTEPNQLFQNLPEQDFFLESMAAAAQAVHEYFAGGQRIMYINVMNNMSIDCDCDSHPAAPQLKDMGILASTDPVALDQACLDLVFNHTNQEGDTAKPLTERIQKLHGTHTVDYAEQIGLGSKKYELISIDK